MDMVLELIVGLMILAGAYVWVKNKFLQPEILQDIDIAPIRGVPLVKKNQIPPVITVQEVERLVEPEVEQVEAKVESVEPIQISEVVMAVEQYSGYDATCQQIPEDSVLKRHYHARIEAERLSLSNPYPSDSVLRRHHESAILPQLKESVKLDASVEVEASINPTTQTNETSIPDQIIPEDSVLRRHYQQLIQSNLAAI